MKTFRLGEKVKISLRCARWNAKHLGMYEVAGEIKKKHYPEIIAWAVSAATKKRLIGKVTGFGSEANLRVTVEGPCGEFDAYFDPKDLLKRKVLWK
jgi:hypothetical protein